MTAYGLLDELMTAAGEESAAKHVDFLGEDPVFPVPLRIGEVGAATIAASAVQAARLWQMRTGRMQDVQVPVDAAAIAMRSARYIRSDPPPPARERRAGEGRTLFRTRDERWIYFQRLFQHHRDRTAAVLGCADRDDEMEVAVRQRDALELEEAIMDAGACGGLVRTAEEWQQHEQARSLKQLPLFEIIKLRDGPPEPLPDGDRPLSGVRVLDVTRVLAGPTCARTFAEHGATVLRVGTDRYPDNEAMQRDTGHGKRSCAIDLTMASGVEDLKRLVAGADVFSQGYRPGTLAARGFGVEEVVAMRPGIVYVTFSAFSHAGPWRYRRGFDSVVQAVSGIYDECAANGQPRSAGVNVLDYATGYLAAFGAMVALGRRAREGGSYLVRVSLAQTGRWLSETPRVDPEAMASRPPDLPQERIDELMTSSETPFGRLRHFAPVARLSETPPRWDLPTAPLDNDPPAWV